MSLTIRSQSRPASISAACSALVAQCTSPSVPSSSTSRVAADLVVFDEEDACGGGVRHVLKSSLKISRAIMALVPSYSPPAGDPIGDAVRGRAWTYDSAVTAAALAVFGDIDGATAILDRLQELQRPDGALDASYDLAGGDPAGPLRSGNQAWVGLAALASGRHPRLLAGVTRWLLDQREEHGLVRGGPDASWVSTEHNLEARALFAGLGEDVSRLDRAHRRVPLRRRPLLPGPRRRRPAARRPGLRDPLAARRGRRAQAEAVEQATDAAMFIDGRRLRGQTFCGYRPFAHGPDVLWMEGTLMMRLAKARLGRDVGALDDSADRWAALTAPEPPLQVDRAAGDDYHVWPAAAPAAWLTLSRAAAPG